VDQLPISCNYHLFREGIEPKWEDKANEGGGKWVHAQPKQQQQQQRKIDRSWIATCVAAISEQLELADDVNHVCGVVVSARKNQDRLCLWLSGSESAVMAIGARWKQLLDLRGQVKIGYQVHAEAISGGTTGGSSFSRSAKFVL
jgi:translation initiation factor 4E